MALHNFLFRLMSYPGQLIRNLEGFPPGSYELARKFLTVVRLPGSTYMLG